MLHEDSKVNLGDNGHCLSAALLAVVLYQLMQLLHTK